MYPRPRTITDAVPIDPVGCRPGAESRGGRAFPRLSRAATALLVIVMTFPLVVGIGHAQEESGDASPASEENVAAEVDAAEGAELAEELAEDSALEVSEERAEENIFAFDPFLSGLTAIVLVVLLTIVARTGWNPLLEALNERDQHLQQCLDQARQAREQSQDLLRQYREDMAKANDQVREVIESARREATTEADARLREVQAKAEQQRAEAEQEIARARQEAIAEIDQQSDRLAAQVALRVMDRPVDPAEVTRLASQVPGTTGSQGATT